MIILRALVPSVGYAWLRMSTTRRSEHASSRFAEPKCMQFGLKRMFFHRFSLLF